MKKKDGTHSHCILGDGDSEQKLKSPCILKGDDVLGDFRPYVQIS